jgi:hypothetical protein
VLETEATHMGIGRGDLLVLLLRRKRGEQPLERSPAAPTYAFTEDEFTTFRLYTWYVKPELRPIIEDDCRYLGQSSIASWINMLLAQWIGQPAGLHPESPSRTHRK